MPFHSDQYSVESNNLEDYFLVKDIFDESSESPVYSLGTLAFQGTSVYDAPVEIASGSFKKVDGFFCLRSDGALCLSYTGKVLNPGPFKDIVSDVLYYNWVAGIKTDGTIWGLGRMSSVSNLLTTPFPGYVYHTPYMMQNYVSVSLYNSHGIPWLNYNPPAMVQLSSDTDWKYIASDKFGDGLFAIKTDGTMWFHGSAGRLSDRPVVNQYFNSFTPSRSLYNTGSFLLTNSTLTNLTGFTKISNDTWINFYAKTNNKGYYFPGSYGDLVMELPPSAFWVKVVPGIYANDSYQYTLALDITGDVWRIGNGYVTNISGGQKFKDINQYFGLTTGGVLYGLNYVYSNSIPLLGANNHPDKIKNFSGVKSFTRNFSHNGSNPASLIFIKRKGFDNVPPPPVTGCFGNGVYDDYFLTKQYLMDFYPEKSPISIRPGLFHAGDNSTGQAGISNTLDNSIPTIVSINEYKDVSTGKNHSVLIKKDGTLFSVGSGADGRTGLGSTTNTSSPVLVSSDPNWLMSFSGEDHSISMKKDGSLWSMGKNDRGQLGHGDITSRSVPTVIADPNAGWKKATGNYYTSVAIKPNGRMFRAGYLINTKFTDTGIDVIDVQSDYYQNRGFLFIKSDGTLWRGYDNGYTQIGGTETGFEKLSTNFSSDASIFLIKSNGTLWGLWSNQYGQLGLGNQLFQNSPVQIGNSTNWKKVEHAYRGYMLGVKTDGTLWSCGYNGYGELGLGNYIHRSSPTQIGSLNTWKDISAQQYTGQAIKTDGTLWRWGQGTYSLGGSSTVITSPVQVGSLTDWKEMQTNGYFTVALKTDGTMWGWGYSVDNQQPGRTGSIISSPIQIGSKNDWVKVDVGFAINTKGELWSWGFNSNGQGGIGNQVSIINPTLVIDPNLPVPWSKVSLGSKNSLSIRSDGTLWGFGDNSLGQLGLSNTTGRSIPTQIGSLTSWKSVSSGTSFSMAIDSDSKIYSFGDNTFGQLGSGTTTSRSSPVMISNERWRSVSAGGNHFLGIRSNGTLWSCGDNSSGQLGVGNTTSVSSPVQIEAATDWIRIHANHDSSFGIRADGTLWSWGLNDVGQLGLGDTLNTSIPTRVTSYDSWKSIKSFFKNTLLIKEEGNW